MTPRALRRRAFLAVVAALFSVAACGRGGPVPHPPVEPPPLPEGAAAVSAEAPTAPPSDPAGPPPRLLVADFELIGEFNDVGGKFGPWASQPPGDPEAKVLAALVPEGEGGGSAWRLRYDVSATSGGKGAYGGIWMHLMGLDVSSCSALVFSARAIDAAPDFFVELKDDEGRRTSRARATGIGAGWTRVRIPLTHFKEIRDWKKLHEMAFVFDQNVAKDREGTYLVDRIGFE